MRLAAKPGRGGKVDILIDGEYWRAVDMDFWYSCGLLSGDEIGEDALMQLEAASLAYGAFHKALDYLSRRDYCGQELLQKLSSTFGRQAAAQAVEKAVELGLVEDARYAQRLAQELSMRKGMSAGRICQALMQRGVAREIATNVAQGLDIDPQSRIIELLETKFAGKYGDEKGRRRVFNSLVRLGYGFTDIRRAMREVEIFIDGTEEEKFFS